jgi:hypothetical protein
MRSRSWHIFLGAMCFSICLIFVLGCTKKEPEAVADKKVDLPIASKKVATPERSTKFKPSDNDCVGPLKKAKKPKIIEFGNMKFKLDGYLLSQIQKEPGDDHIVIGVLSDSKENSAENRKNLSRIIDFFKKEKVEAIIHLGDVASIMPMPEEIEVPEKDAQGNPLTEIDKERYKRNQLSKARRESMSSNIENIVEMVAVLAQTDLPVFVISGNRECKTTFNSAMTTLAQDYPNVFNLNMVRRVDLADVDIISMPGYYDPEYIHCSWDKCLYYESDTLSIIDLARESDDMTFLVSHGPPRQKGRKGIDVVSEGANVGNPWLTNAIMKAGISYGAFGNIQEAGGVATNLDGTKVLPQDAFFKSLFLNPGPSDSMIWAMNDGSESKGMAAVVELKNKQAKYKAYRIGQK